MAAGPVGANGLRPQLAWDTSRWGPQPAPAQPAASTAKPKAVAEPRHSYAVAAAMADAKAQAAAKHPGAAGANANDGAASGTKTAQCDEDGFQLVSRRRKAPAPAKPAEVAAEADQVQGGGAAASGSPGDDGKDQGPEGRDDIDDMEDDDDPQREDAEGGSDPAELHRKWREEAAIAKRLAQQGIPQGHPALVAACSARDEAERRWREAKDPAPIALRLQRAQERLDKAIEHQSATRLAMSELESEFKAKYVALEDRLVADREKVSERRRQLEEIQEEAGAMAPRGIRRGGGEAVRQVCGNLRDIAPAVANLVQHLDVQTPAWQTLSGLLGSLAVSQRLLEGAIGQEGSTAQAFDIGDDAWSESHDLAGAKGSSNAGLASNGGSGGCGGGGGPHADHGQQRDQDMGSGAWWESGQQWRQDQPRWHECGHGKWSRSDWADAWEEEHAAAGAADEGGTVEPSAKHRRQDQRQDDQQQGTAAGTAAAEAAANAASAVARAEASRLLAERAAAVTLQAIEAGIQPLTPSGEELHLLDANQLEAWVAECMLPQIQARQRAEAATAAAAAASQQHGQQ